MKSVILPSAFLPKASNSSSQFVSLEEVFWKKCFTKEFLNLLDLKLDINIQSFFDFFSEHSDFIYEGINSVFADSEKISELKYHFDIIHTYLVLLNKLQNSFEISLSHGLVSTKDRFFNNLDEVPEDTVYKITEFLFNSFSFSEDDEICFKIYWPTNILISQYAVKILNKKYGITKFSLDFGDANEQSDYTIYEKSVELNNFFTSIQAQKKLDEQTGNYHTFIDVFNLRRMATRLLHGKCHWNKCKFCTINYGRNGEEAPTSVTEKVKCDVERLIQEIKEKNIQILTFVDEAISLEIAEYFAKKIIENKIHILWAMRNRINPEMDSFDFTLLHKAGLRFLGIGLETVCDNVAKKMNKRDFSISLSKLKRINKNFEKTGINIHYYMILGFPGENKVETRKSFTYMNNLLKYKMFGSYSANVFALMTNSYIYDHPEEFKIKIEKKENWVAHPFTYINPRNKYSQKGLLYFSRSAYRNMFYSKKIDHEKGYTFWDFMDYTGIFYVYKLIYKMNPFLYINKQTKRLEMNVEYTLMPVWLTNEKGTELFSFLFSKTFFFSDKKGILLKNFIENYTFKSFSLKNFSKNELKIAKILLKTGYLIHKYDLQNIEDEQWEKMKSK